MGNSCNKPKQEAPQIPSGDIDGVSVDVIDVDVDKPDLTLDKGRELYGKFKGSDDGSENSGGNGTKARRQRRRRGPGGGSNGSEDSSRENGGERRRRRRNRKKRVRVRVKDKNGEYDYEYEYHSDGDGGGVGKKRGQGNAASEGSDYTYQEEEPGWIGWLSGDEGTRRRIRRRPQDAANMSESSSWGIDNAFDKTTRSFAALLGFEEDPREREARRSQRGKGNGNSGNSGDDDGDGDGDDGDDGDRKGEGKRRRRRKGKGNDDNDDNDDNYGPGRRRRRKRTTGNPLASGSDEGERDGGRSSSRGGVSEGVNSGNGNVDELSSSVQQAKQDKKPLSAHEKEVVEKMTALLHEKFHDDGKEGFMAYDKDGDGEIDPDEMYSLLEDAKIGNMITRSRWAKGIMDKFDADHNGKISLDEFMTRYTKSKKKQEEAQRQKR